MLSSPRHVTGVNAAAKAAVSTSDVRIPLQFLVSRVTVLDSATLSDDAAAWTERAKSRRFGRGGARVRGVAFTTVKEIKGFAVPDALL